jgi:Holliday junction resolvase RusA-like endonuclease
MQYNQYFPVRPKVKQRPRVLRNGHTYTPKVTLEYERELASLYKGPRFSCNMLAVKMLFSHDGVEIQIEELRPKPDVEMPKTKLRGDIDNYVKAVLDALNGIAWGDDSRVVVLHAEKA